MTEIIPPKRGEAIVDGIGIPTNRMAVFLEDLQREVFNIRNDTSTGITLEPESVTDVELAPNSVIQGKIANNAVQTPNIENAAVLASKIADSNVTTPKIADSNVTTVKIANNAITTEKLETFSVTEEKLANNSVTANKLSVTADDIPADDTGFLNATGGTVQQILRDLDLELEQAKLPDWVRLLNNYTAKHEDRLAPTGGVVVTLPASPSSGDYVTIYDYTRSASIVVARNGSTIEGLAEDLNMNMPGITVELLYLAGTWRVRVHG